MTFTMWGILTDAIKTLSNGLLNDQDNYDVQMGLVSFGSQNRHVRGCGWRWTTEIFYEISNFKNNDNQYFTKSSQQLLNNDLL
ncbi:hypothetical protein, partial [Mammaliicoccus sciuri]|uniref:hypothetical protein n=1 Tax=Mammaliicoccus sciuri TaxID=1296 RepID=UPI001F0E4327